jgi:spore coat polysaccharide biosynthesis protein SpsF (cytidylyltransferase family)
VRIVAILQARLGSTRLPGKVLLPLAGKPMLQNIIERVQRATTIDAVVVTYPLGDGAALVPILDACRQRNAEGYATKQVFGSQWWDDPNDLVGRYLQAAITHNADLVVRIPCDNPCVDPEYLDDAVRTYLRDPFIYYSNTTAYVDDVAVDGVGAEVFSVSRLKWLDQRVGDRADWREHPHRYFESCGLLSLPTAPLRLDVNTQQEYECIAEIYAHFGHNHFTSADILTYLATKEAPHEKRERSTHAEQPG